MPGNEVADKVHNFFEQDNLSQGQQQSQVGSGNWPVLNRNLWVGNQGQIGASISSSPTNYSLHQSDSERGNGRHSMQMPIGTNFTQLTLRPEFSKGQSRNHQLNLNGFMHEHQGLHTRQNQGEFLGENTVSDRHNLTLRGLPIIESQQGNAPEHNPNLTRNSERLETAEAPISFDFLGGQQQLMRGQQPVMPQPRPSQQSGFSDMQLWQQHLMFKQLQELQSQQQLQQIDQEVRQPNPVNQLSSIAKQAAGGHLPALVNGMPIRDASNNLWPGELIRGDSKLPHPSQMFMVGNMNWTQHGGSPAAQGIPNGLTFSNEQGQVLRSVGLVSQQLDQSLYGAPISSRGMLNHYPHLQGIPHDRADMSSKAGSNQVGKAIMNSSAFSNSFQDDQSAVFQDQESLQDGNLVSKQGLQGKNLFGHAPVQGLNTGVLPSSFQQVASLPRNVSAREFHGRQDRGGWSGSLEENAATEVVPSQGSVSLDPTEEKILFNTDDKFWDDPFGRSGIMGTGGSGNHLDGTDYLNTFPSIQSGSWSALMQSAVAEASSSDTGLQDEWSGLSYQKTELPTGNQTTTFGDSAKQQTNWVDNNFQSASSLTSRPFPLFDDANVSPSGHSIHGFQQPGIKFSYEQSEKFQPNASRDSNHQSPEEASKWLDRNLQHNQYADGSHQVQPPTGLKKVSEGAWAGRSYDQSGSASHSADTELGAQSMQGSWVHRQSMSSYNIGSAPFNKPNGWNINESLSSGGEDALKSRESENTFQLSQRNDHNKGMHMRIDHDVGIWRADGSHVANSIPNFPGGLEQLKSVAGTLQANREDSRMNNFTAVSNPGTPKTNQELRQQLTNSHHLDYGKQVVDSSVEYKGDESVGKFQNQQKKGPRVLESSMNNSDRGSGEKYGKNLENLHQQEISNDGYNFNQLLHTVPGGGVRQNLWLNQSDSHAMASGNQKSTGQVGRKASGPRRFQHHPMGNLEVNVDPADTVKNVTHSQSLPQQASRGSKSHEQGYTGQSRLGGHVRDKAIDMEKGHLNDFQGNTKRSAEVPFRGVMPGYESTASGSVDGSAGFFIPNKMPDQTSQNMLELLHKVDQPREPSMVKHLSSSDHEPSSEMPEPDASDTSVAHIQQNKFSSPQGFGLRLAPPSQRMPVSNQAFSSQNSSQIINNINSRNADSEVGEKGQRWLGPASSVQSFTVGMSQREHWDNKPSNTGHRIGETSHSNMQGNSSSTLAFPRNQQQHQHMSSASGQVMTDQSMNISFDRFASQFRQTHETRNGVVADQSAQALLRGASSSIPPSNLANPADAARSISANSSHLRSPSQQLSVLEAVPVSHPSGTSGMSQQGAFSTMLHNVWANVSTQQRLQSTNASNNNLESTSWVTQKPDNKDVRTGGNGPSELDTCTVNSQPFAYGEEQPGKESSWQHIPSEKVDLVPQTSGALQGQESASEHLSNENITASCSPVAHTHHQKLDIGIYGKDPALVSQTEHTSLQNPAISNSDIKSFGRSLKPSHVMHQNYSLLHQVQAMKGVETDPNKRGGKRFKGADCGPDAQLQAAKAGQQLLYGYSGMVRDDLDNELNPATRHTSFPSVNSKMLSFSSEARENQHTNASSQNVPDVPSQDVVTCDRSNSFIHSSHLSSASIPSEHSQISPQMAPSWFEQYGSFKNGQILRMSDAREMGKAAPQQFIFTKASESMHAHTSAEQINAADASQVGRVWKSTTTDLVASEQLALPYSLPSEFADQSLAIVGPKKRKSATLELLPWHKEVTHGSQRLQNISMAELDWAQAANRLIEKVEDEAVMIDDGQQMLRIQRRLVLTTQLMQQLLRPAPSAILSTDATSDYGIVTYFVAKLALGDACSLISYPGSDSHVPPENGNMSSARLKTFERMGDQHFSKVVEDFIDRTRKLENDLLRLDKRASILDVRVECQDLEKFSIMNRFAKFHGKGQSDGTEASSSYDTATSARKTFPQRYVVALAMPRNPPEGVQCLSL